jgi:Domain of unknown function (DUF4928)
MDNLVEYNFLESYLQDFEARRPDLEDTANLLAVIRSLLAELPVEQRKEILGMQGFLFDKLSDYQPEPIRFPFDPLKSTWQLVCDLLDAAHRRGCEPFVAFHLVWATLQRSFPRPDPDTIECSMANVQLDRHGDIQVGNTIFHVTVAPTLALYEKCKRNLREGFRVYLLVRNKDVVGTKQNAENTAAGQIAVESIETFVSQNLDELAVFSQERRGGEFRQLLETYNRRVGGAETNKSLMVEIPVNLRAREEG